MGRLNELLITAIEQTSDFAPHQGSGGDGERGLIGIVDGIVAGDEHSGDAVTADQGAACNRIGGSHIKAVGTQEFKCLIEVWMA